MYVNKKKIAKKNNQKMHMRKSGYDIYSFLNKKKTLFTPKLDELRYVYNMRVVLIFDGTRQQFVNIKVRVLSVKIKYIKSIVVNCCCCVNSVCDIE